MIDVNFSEEITQNIFSWARLPSPDFAFFFDSIHIWKRLIKKKRFTSRLTFLDHYFIFVVSLSYS